MEISNIGKARRIVEIVMKIDGEVASVASRQVVRNVVKLRNEYVAAARHHPRDWQQVSDVAY